MASGTGKKTGRKKAARKAPARSKPRSARAAAPKRRRRWNREHLRLATRILAAVAFVVGVVSGVQVAPASAVLRMMPLSPATYPLSLSAGKLALRRVAVDPEFRAKKLPPAYPPPSIEKIWTRWASMCEA